MRSTGIFAASVGLVFLASGCGQGYCDPYYDPYCGYYGPVDYAGVGVDPWGYCADPLFCGCTDIYACLTKASPVTSASTTATGSCAPGDTTCLVQVTSTSVNQALQSALMPVDALLGLQPAKQGDVMVFGPLDAGPPGNHGAPAATFRLGVRQTSGKVTWKLEARPLGATSSWVEVFTGSMITHGNQRRGQGVLGVDVDALAGINSAVYVGGGKVLGAFANDDAQKATAYRLVELREGAGSVSDGLLTSSTDPDGNVRTTLSASGGPPLTANGTSQPLAGGSGQATSSAPPLDPGAAPAVMPDPGF